MQRRWKVLTGLVVARIAFAFQLQTVAVVAPGIIEDLSIDALSIGTLIGLFSLPGLVLAIPGGFLGQWIGERRFLTACLLAMIMGAILCAVASDAQLLWFGRLLAGFGGIGLNVVMSKIVLDWFAGQELATAMALFLAGYPLGIALAMVSLGHLATPAHWQIAFYVNAALGLIALFTFIATCPDTKTRKSGAGGPPKLRLGEIAMVSLVGFVWALFNAAHMVYISFLPLYLVGSGMSPSLAASLVSIGLWIAIAMLPLGGAAVDRFGNATVVILVGVTAWGISPLLAVRWLDSVPLLLAALAIGSMFGSIAASPMVALASEVLRPEARGAGMGIHYTWLYGGIAFGPIIGGYVFDATSDPRAPLFAIAALCALSLLMLLVFRRLQWAAGRSR